MKIRALTASESALGGIFQYKLSIPLSLKSFDLFRTCNGSATILWLHILWLHIRAKIRIQKALAPINGLTVCACTNSANVLCDMAVPTAISAYILNDQRRFAVYPSKTARFG